MTKNRIVLFDWNGTFVNDETQTVEAFRDVLKGIGDERHKLSFDELINLHRQTFDIPLNKMYSSLGLDFNQAEMAKENLFWTTKYFSLEHTIKMQDGIKRTIELLSNNGILFGILSNHETAAINKALINYGYENTLVLANTHGHEAHEKGKLHRLEKYCDENPSVEVCAIVGDSTEEIEIARSVETTSIAFDNGWVPIERLKPANPDYLINSRELPETVTEILEL